VYLIEILDIGMCQDIKLLLFVEQTVSFAWSTTEGLKLQIFKFVNI
jgi:hypothetical protein